MGKHLLKITHKRFTTVRAQWNGALVFPHYHSEYQLPSLDGFVEGEGEVSEFKSPKDCREPEYQEFVLSRWKNLSDEEKKICLENKKTTQMIIFFRYPRGLRKTSTGGCGVCHWRARTQVKDE